MDLLSWTRALPGEPGEPASQVAAVLPGHLVTSDDPQGSSPAFFPSDERILGLLRGVGATIQRASLRGPWKGSNLPLSLPFYMEFHGLIRSALYISSCFPTHNFSPSVLFIIKSVSFTTPKDKKENLTPIPISSLAPLPAIL